MEKIEKNNITSVKFHWRCIHTWRTSIKNTSLESKNYDSEKQQYPMQIPNAGCRTEYQTVFDVEEVETEEQICNTVFELSLIHI